MKRDLNTAKLPRDSARLVRIALAMEEAGSQIERETWQQQALTLIASQFQKKNNETLEQTLDFLWVDHPAACEALSVLIDSCAESLTHAAGYNTVLLAVPMLAWSRYSIPSGQLKPQRLQELRQFLQETVLADDVKLALADTLYSPDQLPRGFIETHELLEKLNDAVQQGRDYHPPTDSMPKVGEYVADVRYVFAAASFPKGASIFRWQNNDITPTEVLTHWTLASKTWLSQVFPGCHIQALLPNAFFSAWRKLEQESRPFALRAAVSYLCEVLAVLPAQLQAVVVPCYDNTLEEYRIGLSLLNKGNILHGVVWPLVDDEHEDNDVLPQIEAELTQLGKVIVLANSMPVEYCDECGTPLFPNADGDLQHPEMPEGEAIIPHLH